MDYWRICLQAIILIRYVNLLDDLLHEKTVNYPKENKKKTINSCWARFFFRLLGPGSSEDFLKNTPYDIINI